MDTSDAKEKAVDLVCLNRPSVQQLCLDMSRQTHKTLDELEEGVWDAIEQWAVGIFKDEQ